ncbi:hypothetical protein pipiens_015085 [Culex pipiens pipiens]|uniref:Cytochrome P450 n=2 Tax=Culex pipiens TaxID=7175 RepID=A0ABD1CS61_CULPP
MMERWGSFSLREFWQTAGITPFSILVDRAKMVTEWLVFLLSWIAFYGFYIRWTRRKQYDAARGMEGPKAYPLIGAGYKFLGKSTPEQLHQVLTEITSTYRSPAAVWLGQNLCLFLHKPEHAQAVLKSNDMLNRANFHRYFNVNKGILTQPAHTWKAHRKMLNLCFSPSILKGFMPTINQKSQVFVEQLVGCVGKPEQNIYLEVGKWALDTISATVLGLDYHLQKTDAAVAYLKNIDEYLTLVTKRMATAHQHPDLLYILTRDFRDFARTGKQFYSFSSMVMDSKKDFINPEVMADFKENPRKPRIFIDMVYQMAAADPDHLADEDIRDHLDEVIFAGHDAIATTMAYIMLMMAMHPEVQERVHQEVMSVCPDEGAEFSLEDCNKLTYTEMVCKETMRLFPVGPIIGRRATADVSCTAIRRFGDRTRTGSIRRTSCRRRPDQRHPYSFLPFSAGSRNCLGYRYAWLPMKIMLAYLARSYRLKTSLTMDQLTLQNYGIIILRIAQGCQVTVEQREGSKLGR